MAESRHSLADASRTAGALLIFASVMTVFAMAHHPSGHGAGDGGGISLVGVVHATMIILLAVNMWGLTVLSGILGLGGLPLAGLVTYAIGFVANFAAATINGFIVPAVAGRVDHSSAGDLFSLLWESNQALARIGVYAVSAAILFWSIAILRRIVPANRILAALGLIAAIAPASILAAGVIEMDVKGAMLVYGAHAAWIAAIGIQLYRRALT